MGNVMMEASQINYRGGVTKMSVEQALKETSGEAAAIAALQAAVGNLQTGKADLPVIAPEFDAETGVYAVGDLVMYQGKLYEFTTAHETAGDWDSTEVTEKTVSDEIDSLKSGLSNLGTVELLVHEEMPVAAQWTAYQDISINVSEYRFFGIRLASANRPSHGTPLCLFSRAELLSSTFIDPLCALFNVTELTDSYNVYVLYDEDTPTTPLFYYRGSNVTDTLFLTIVGIK